jgi:hypothetical protein
MTDKRLRINRAPVLTLWAAVVAERLGYDREAALTLGKAVAGLNAQSKGRRLGIFGEASGRKAEPEAKPPRPAEQRIVTVLGRSVPVLNTAEGIRATERGCPIDPRGVERYLDQKFGEDLAEARSAMEALARSLTPEALAGRAYTLYESFRPIIPEGRRGWGAQGHLDLAYVRSLARKPPC